MLILIGSFLVMLMLKVPVLFSMGISSGLYLMSNEITLMVIGQRMTTMLMSFTLLAVPFFVLLAELFNAGNSTKRLIRFVLSLVGWVSGGLGIANVGISMLFAGVSGTAAADSSGLGTFLIPAMEKEGYDKAFSAAVTSASASVGPIIPPSIAMVIAGVSVSLSVTDLFLAGAIPGLLMGFSMMILTYFISVKRKYPKSQGFDIHEVWASFKDCVWELLLVLFIFFGIVGGFFTPTEAGAMGAAATLFIGVVIKRELTARKIFNAVARSAALAGVVIIIIGFAGTFGWAVAKERVPEQFAAWILSVTDNWILVMVLVNIALLILGAIMETTAAIIITMPTLIALGNAIGMNPIQLTVIVVVNLILGMSTPPLGVSLLIVSAISKEGIGPIVKDLIPYYLVNFLVLAGLVMIPQLTLWLPEFMRAFR